MPRFTPTPENKGDSKRHGGKSAVWGFTKEERILKSSRFDEMYKTGKKFFSRNFFIVFVKGDKKRIGLTVSSKVGKANLRNRLKRALREYFRSNKDKFPLGDVIITARAGAASLENKDIRGEIAKLLQKIM